MLPCRGMALINPRLHQAFLFMMNRVPQTIPSNNSLFSKENLIMKNSKKNTKKTYRLYILFEEGKWRQPEIEYSRAVTPPVRQDGNRLSRLAETACASLLA